MFQGITVTEEELQEVAALSGVLEIPNDFLEVEFRDKCKVIITEPEHLLAKDYVTSYLYIKNQISL